MNKWKEILLEDACDILTCGVASTPKYVDEKEGVPFLSAQNVKDGQINLEKYNYVSKDFHEHLTKKNKPRKGDILYSRVGAKYGEAAIVDFDFEFSVYVSLTLIRPKSEIFNNEFFKYYLNSPIVKQKAKKSIKSSGVPNLNVKDVRGFNIPIPPLEEQQTIVAKLDQAFAAIDQAKYNIEKNISNAKELFQSKLNQIFSQKGEGFIEEKLDNVLIKTKNINPKDFPGKTFRYVDVSAVDRNKLEITEFSEINSDNAPSRARKLILENDVIFATVRPTLRRVTIIDKNFDSQICSTGYVVLRNNNNKLLPKMIYYYLLTSYFLENIEKLQKGASYPAVTDGEVKSQLINYPKSLEIQQQIVNQLDQLQEQTNLLVTKYQQKLANLEELKKSILEKAFKGELV